MAKSIIQSVGHKPVAFMSPKSSVEMETLRPHSKPLFSELAFGRDPDNHF